MAPGVCGNGSVPLKVVTRIGIHTHTQIFKVRGLDNREYLVIIRDIFCQFCTLTYVVIPQLNHLDKTVQIRVHNIRVQLEIRKSIPQLSPNTPLI